jgi:hypothetical protein
MVTVFPLSVTVMLRSRDLLLLVSELPGRLPFVELDDWLPDALADPPAEPIAKPGFSTYSW